MPTLDKQYKKDYYHSTNREKQIKAVAMRRAALTIQFAEYKSTLKCSKCGFSHPAALDFHHLDPAKKDIAVSQMVANGNGWNRIMEEVAKCIVLCSNCHRILHYEERNGVLA
jgi:hypothetical protein